MINFITDFLDNTNIEIENIIEREEDRIESEKAINTPGAHFDIKKILILKLSSHNQLLEDDIVKFMNYVFNVSEIKCTALDVDHQIWNIEIKGSNYKIDKNKDYVLIPSILIRKIWDFILQKEGYIDEWIESEMQWHIEYFFGI